MVEVTAPADWQQQIIENAQRLPDQDSRILAVWLGGSFGAGEQDAFSDVDLHLLVTEEAATWFVDHWSDVAAEIAAAPLVLATSLKGLTGGYVLTDAFRHLDLIVHPCVSGAVPTADELFHDFPSLVLADPRLLLPTPPPRSVLAAGAPIFRRELVLFAFYMLHAFSVCVQRGELILVRNGCLVMRDLLVELMLAENGIRRRGGNKRLNAFLADEQRLYLESLPPTGPALSDMIDQVAMISREFIRRGRRLAGVTGEEWPEPLERAAFSYLAQTLDFPG